MSQDSLDTVTVGEGGQVRDVTYRDNRAIDPSPPNDGSGINRENTCEPPNYDNSVSTFGVHRVCDSRCVHREGLPARHFLETDGICSYLTLE